MIKGDKTQEGLKNDFANIKVWKSIVKQYKINLHKFIEEGFDKMHHIYRPISHAVQESRPVQAYPSTTKKRRRGRRKRKGK